MANKVTLKENVIQRDNNRHIEDSITLKLEKRFFYVQAKYSIEYLFDANITRDLMAKLEKDNVDIFTFVERSFLYPPKKYSFFNAEVSESIAILTINSFDHWWSKQIDKKTRNMIRKAEKTGVVVKLVTIDDKFIKGAQMIYNETPIRQGRRYEGYGLRLADVRKKFENLQDSEILGAYIGQELIGLLWLAYGDSVARVRSFVSLVKERNRAPNNMLMSEGVRRCSDLGYHFIVYEKMGFLPGLDAFKLQNGFRRFSVSRYYVPLTYKGMLVLKLKIYKEIQYSLPIIIHRSMLPIFNFLSKKIPPQIWERVFR